MLTSAQLATLKADILADPVLAAKPNTADGAFEIAQTYNATAAPDFFVLRTDVPVDEVYDNVQWANYTPQDAPDNTVTYQNRAMLCQTKQINLQLMLQGRTTFNAGRVNLRAGLNDATTALPSGAAGASRSGGWAGILPVLRRKARRVEKLYAVATTGVGTGVGNLGDTGNPGLMGYEGTVSGDDVAQARAS